MKVWRGGRSRGRGGRSSRDTSGTRGGPGTDRILLTVVYLEIDRLTLG